MPTRRNRSFDRDTVLGAAFILPALVIPIYLVDRKPPDTVFWLCCGVCLLCLVSSKHWWAPISATALYAIGPLLAVAIFQRRREAGIGVAACAAVLGVAWWFSESPNRRAREAFAHARYCPGCSRPLRGRRLHHPAVDGRESQRHWFYRCTCGECTIFDVDGNATRVEMASRASDSAV